MLRYLFLGLFHRGISQSGTVLCSWALSRPGLAKKKAQKLGQLLKCPTSDSKELLRCLKEKSHIEITSTDRAFQVTNMDSPLDSLQIRKNQVGADLILDKKWFLTQL